MDFPIPGSPPITIEEPKINPPPRTLSISEILLVYLILLSTSIDDKLAGLVSFPSIVLLGFKILSLSSLIQFHSSQKSVLLVLFFPQCNITIKKAP